MTRRALLVHGLNAAPADWDRFRAPLDAGDWDVETATLLGHAGRPTAPRYTVADFAADLPGGPWDLVVAHSLGAAAATLRAGEPDWCRTLVLLDPVWLVPGDQVAVIAAEQEAELSLTADELAAAQPQWHPADRAAKLAGIRGVQPEVSTRAFTDSHAAGGWDVIAAAERLPVPTLVVQGDPGVFTLLQPAVADAVVGRNPAVRHVILPGTGHAPHRDDLDATWAAIREWQPDLSAGGGSF